MFITFEGIEGCGKSTQAERLARRLNSLGIAFVLTREPGGTEIGGDIRRVLLNPQNKILPLAELLLYAADRAQHVGEIIGPALAAGKWVLCDRFFDATVVYQGNARGQDISLIKNLNAMTSDGIRPDITFLIDCPVEIGLTRALRRESEIERGSREEQDRFEKEHKKFHEAVRQGYLDLAEGEPNRFIVVDGTLGMDEMEGTIFEHIRPLLEIR